jgi:Trypsin
MAPPNPPRIAKRVPAVVIAFVSATLLSCSGDDLSAPALGSENLGPRFITDGVPTGESFGNVGAALFDFDESGTIDGFETFCSGSLIAPTVFLTAAHCVVFFPPDAQLYVSFDPALLPGPPNVIAAEESHFDPAFGHDRANLHDLGVIILPSGSTSGITPLSLPPAGLLDELAAQGGLRGQLFVNVGYGVDASQQGHPAFAFDGVRRTSKSPFKGLNQYWLNLHMNTNKTDEGGVCFGDSGSPHFLDGNPGMVVATTTGGDVVCRALNFNYRLDTEPARAFLDQFVTLP